MSGLPRPDLPPGAHQDLVDRLHEVHHLAGWPSLRTIAADVGCSPTTVSAVFSRPRLPAWGFLELVVESLGGDSREFHALWLSATRGQSAGGATKAVAPSIAGRREELTQVRRHLSRQPAGLLLITGEAGLGKTRLAASATAATPDIRVLTATSIPAAAPVPLLPVADLVRAALEEDDGQWVKEALAAAPAFVTAELAGLVPELEHLAPAAAVPSEPSPQRMFAAVRSLLVGLGETRRAAVVLDDLHWADPFMLDLLEHLLTLSTGLPLPVVATWRTHEPDVPAATLAWSTRVRRHPRTAVLPLTPLSLADTREQLRLLGKDPEAAGWIHPRAAGNPLFAEQLAVDDPAESQLPDLLTDLLDQRLARLSDEARRVANTLAVIGRPATTPHLVDAVGSDFEAVTHGLRQLQELHLATVSGPEVGMSHPLLAEAALRRLVATEAVDTHARVARAKASWPQTSAAEVADHWRAAADLEEELRWRVRAANDAWDRHAPASAADEWTRVLRLWESVREPEEVAGVGLSEAHCAAIDAMIAAARAGEARELALTAMARVDELPAPLRADLLARVGWVTGITDPEAGLDLLAQSIALHEADGAKSSELARVLELRAGVAMSLGRLDLAKQLTSRAVEIAASVGNPSQLRRLHARSAWQALIAGDVAKAFASLARLDTIEIAAPDPLDEIWVGVAHTHTLLLAGRPTAEVADAAAPGLAAVESWGIRNFFCHLLRSHLTEALLREGRVPEATALAGRWNVPPLSLDNWSAHLDLARLDLLAGRLDAAHAQFGRLDGLDLANLLHRVTVEGPAAECALWRGDPEAAFARANAFLRRGDSGDLPRFSSAVHALAARAAADLALATPARSGRLEREVRDLRSQHAPFEYDVPADAHAWGATWEAEVNRLTGLPAAEPWLTAVHQWDRLRRPHEAAYCRWRGAQALRTVGQSAAASRLLARAVKDSQHHVPLANALRVT